MRRDSAAVQEAQEAAQQEADTQQGGVQYAADAWFVAAKHAELMS